MALPDFQNKAVTLLGAGVSNMPLAGYLVSKGTRVSARDKKSEADLEEQRSKVELNRARKEDITGENETDDV